MKRYITLFLLLSMVLLLFSCDMSRSISQRKTEKLYGKTLEILNDNNIRPIYIVEFNDSYEKHIIDKNYNQMFLKNNTTLNYYYNEIRYTLDVGSNQVTKEPLDYTNQINEEQNKYLTLIHDLLDSVESKEGFKATGGGIPLIAFINDFWIEMKLDDKKVKDIFNVENITTTSACIIFSDENNLKGFQFYLEGDIIINILIYFVAPENHLNDIIVQWKNHFNIIECYRCPSIN